MKICRCVFVILLLFLSVRLTFAQMPDLRKEIEGIVAHKQLKLGLSIHDFQTGETFTIHGDDRFPMQSVYKFQIGLAILDNVDKGCCALSDTISIEKKDLSPDLWSPIRETYPEGVSMPLSEVITYAVAQSDNSASDLLLSLIGGPHNVQNYIRGKGIKQMHIVNTEREVQGSWKLQFKNWTTPNAMMQLLKLFNGGELLENETHDFMWQVMCQTQTGSLRRFLPKELIIARKTGHSGQGKHGVTAANNDVGIMVLPDGRRFAFVLFITDSKESSETNYTVIAQIGAAIYDNFIRSQRHEVEMY